MSKAEVKQAPLFAKWTQEKADKAAKEGKYMKLENKSNELLLSGATKRWTADPSFAYIPRYRIAGDLELLDKVTGKQSTPLYSYLTEQIKVDAATAAEVLYKGCYTVHSVVGSGVVSDPDTYNGELVSQFRAELELQSQLKTSKPVAKKAPAYSLEQINALAKTVKEADNVTVEKKAKVAKKPSGASNGRVKPLLDRLLKLSDNKVFDVSAVEEKGSTGAKSIDLPKGQNSKKVLVAVRLINPETKQAVVKNIVSNKLNSLKLALESMFPGDSMTVSSYLNQWALASKVTPAPVTAPIQVKTGISSPNSMVTMPPVANGVPVPQIRSPIMTMNQMLGK